MVGYGEETKGYNLFNTSTNKNFVEISVQFEEEPIPDFELAPRDCSSPQPFEDVSDDTCSIFSDNSDMNVSEDDISVDDSLYRPKWAEKLCKQLGNWQEIPKSLGELDHKLVRLHLQLIVLFLRTVRC